MDATQTAALRPLRIGEMFDRAVTVHVGHFGLFTLLAFAVVLPVAVAEFALVRGGDLQQLIGELGRPGSPSSLDAAASLYAAFGAAVLLQVLLGPFLTIACAHAVADAYQGTRPTWRGCYAQAFSRWLPVLGTICLELFILCGTVVVGSIALAIPFGIGAAALRVPAVGIALIALGVLLAVAWMALLMVTVLAANVAFDAVGVEKAGAVDAIHRSFTRIFNRRELGRAFLVVFALFAVYVALYIVSVALSLLVTGILHSPVVQVGLSAAIGLVSSAFIGVLTAVYYFDLRGRGEA